MYIDFHTHAFADSIAQRAIERLEENIRNSGCEYPDKAVTDGTVADLIRMLDETGVDKAVLLPIATKPSQQTVINNWASEVMSDRLYCFGSVHPDAEDVAEELERIKNLGLKGVKLHPDYQDFMADESKAVAIYKKCAELGLPVILHAGLDAFSVTLIHCTPQMCANILEAVPELTLILAHLGGNACWDEVEKYLVGKNVYLDTAFTSGTISCSQAKRIIKNHGAGKILFASDCPWHNPAEEIRFIHSMNLSDEEKDMIFYKNALKLLNGT